MVRVGMCCTGAWCWVGGCGGGEGGGGARRLRWARACSLGFGSGIALPTVVVCRCGCRPCLTLLMAVVPKSLGAGGRHAYLRCRRCFCVYAPHLKQMMIGSAYHSWWPLKLRGSASSSNSSSVSSFAMAMAGLPLQGLRVIVCWAVVVLECFMHLMHCHPG